MINFDSMQKVFFFAIGIMLLCYCAVSPRHLPLPEYNLRFKENIQIVALSAIVPVMIILAVFDARENDVNTVVSFFHIFLTYWID